MKSKNNQKKTGENHELPSKKSVDHDKTGDTHNAVKSDETHDHDSEHTGHDKHAGHSVAMFRVRFWICLALTVPALIWEPMLQEWFGYTAPTFPGSDLIPAFFGTIVFSYGGLIFLKGAARELKDRLPGMMTLIALAISVAFIYSLAVTFGFEGHALWWELATLVTIMLLGHWIEMRSISQAQGSLKELAKMLPDKAVRLLDNDQTEEVPVSELKEGDLILIRPGAGIPADGIVESGKSSLNEAMVTGESNPVGKKSGDRVVAGTVNGDGSLRVKVEGVGDRTALAGIMKMVEQAQSSRSRAQSLADRAAFYLTLAAIGSGVLTFTAWLLFGASLDFTITRMVTVLVIACPHALGLAVPLVIAISTSLGAQNGLLVRDRIGLEEARKLDFVVFDKTGTLTLGEHRVVETAVTGEIDKKEALRLAAAVEHDSEHPIARALLESAREMDISLPESRDFKSFPGHGVQAQVENSTLKVGGPALLKKLDIELPDEIQKATGNFEKKGQAVVYLIRENKVEAVFALADAVRPESQEAVKSLHGINIKVAMLTGDSRSVADGVAQELGIDTVFAEVLPEDKAKKIQELQKEGNRVAMVGDGVNDAPALATADIGVAIGAGTDVAVEAGHIVLVRSDPRDVTRIVTLSRASNRKMVQNLWFAAGYNIVAIPLAAGVLAWAGILLIPAAGAILMSASTVVVTINAQLLRRLKI